MAGGRWSIGGGVPGLDQLPPDPGKKPGVLSDEELIDAVAKRIVGMRLGVAAVFFLESTRPLSFIGSQVLVFLEPFVQAFLDTANYQRFARLMEDRKNFEHLIDRIELLDEEMREQERKRKREEKEKRRREREGLPRKKRFWFF